VVTSHGRARVGPWAGWAVPVALAVLAMMGSPARAGEQLSRGTTVTLAIIIEGPEGPHPYGHAEIAVTIYDSALAGSPAELGVLGVTRERRAAIELPVEVPVDVGMDELARAGRPAVSAVISAARRPAYVTETMTPLAKEGATRVTVVPVR